MTQEDFESATQHHRAGRFDPAEGQYKQVLAQDPNHAEALGQLGYLFFQTGRNDEAIAFLSRALDLKPASATFQNNLGLALFAAGNVDDAIAAYRQGIALRPDLAEIHNNLADALLARNQPADAVTEFELARVLRPDMPEIKNALAHAQTNLGVHLHAQQRLDEAIAAHQKAVELRPDFPLALFNLGAALRAAGRLDDAIVAYRKCLALQPKYPAALNNLANALRDIGQLDAALVAYDQAITAAAGTDYDAPESNRLYTLYFHPDYDAPAILKEHQQWNRRRAAALGSAIAPHRNDRSPDRKIRIGYVSADFRDHPVGLALEPLLENHDHRQFEIVCFTNSEIEDAVTHRLRSCADHWLSIHSLTDRAAADLVRNEKIDVLIDLSLHMAHNRLLLFAQKPAPIQVTYLGYPGTTGLTTIDYRLSDAHLDPPGSDAAYTERTIRLPSTYICWRWSGADEPLSAPPAAKNGYITFGSLNTFCKVTKPTLETWGKLMSQVKGSRLILRAPPGLAAEWVRESLSRHGISPDRVEITGRMPWDQYVKLCQTQDIGLDPFPYPGHTTSLDSLWLGVPIITLRGNTAVARGGASILSNLNLSELIAGTPEQYIQIAQNLAGDLSRLADLRVGLRRRILQSPIADAPRFARDVEAAYRRMWHEWCRKPPVV
ncbi:MAG: tetratricopeptide repeat protein [Tepidisphaeraceae bacterium]